MHSMTREFKTGWHRPQLDEFPSVGLPFYPRSTGWFRVGTSHREDIPSGTKPFVQLFWLISGEMEFVFDGTDHLLTAGNVCYRLSGEAHIQRVVSQFAEYRWIAFDGKNADSFIQSYGFPRTGWYAGACPSELFVEYEENMREMTPHCWRRMCSIITEILCRAGDHNYGEEESFISKAVSLCRRHHTERDFNVNKLAEMLKVNRTTLNRRFITQAGISAGKYIGQLKIQYALSLLQTTGETLENIAEKSGFYDAPHLCRALKLHYGTTAQALRSF